MRVATRIKKMGMRFVSYHNMQMLEEGLVKELSELYKDMDPPRHNTSHWNNQPPYWTAYLKIPRPGKSPEWVGLCITRENGVKEYIYSFPARRYLISPRPLTIEEYMELHDAKQAELKVAREKAALKIKNVRDVLKIVLKEKEIKWHQGSGGKMRIPTDQEARYCGDVALDILRLNDTSIKLFAGDIEIAVLDLAEPTFNDSLDRIIDNWLNISDILSGHKPNIQK